MRSPAGCPGIVRPVSSAFCKNLSNCKNLSIVAGRFPPSLSPTTRPARPVGRTVCTYIATREPDRYPPGSSVGRTVCTYIAARQPDRYPPGSPRRSHHHHHHRRSPCRPGLSAAERKPKGGRRTRFRSARQEMPHHRRAWVAPPKFSLKMGELRSLRHPSLPQTPQCPSNTPLSLKHPTVPQTPHCPSNTPLLRFAQLLRFLQNRDGLRGSNPPRARPQVRNSASPPSFTKIVEYATLLRIKE